VKIIVTYDPPPIGDRNHDWCAKLDGYEPGDCIGWGQQPETALAELLCAIEDKASEFNDAILRDSRDRQLQRWEE
jgi:hypothetical protein